MKAAQRPGNNNASLRSQLLSTDIGNIDITKEVPINQPQQQQQQQQQQFHQQQYQQQPFYPPPPQQQPQRPYGYGPPQSPGRYNAPQQQYPQSPQGMRPFQPPAQPAPPQQQSPAPRSRRSSIVSTHSNFNSFLRFGKQKKASKGDDYDDDEKDVMMDPSQSNGMSFDDISSIRDRGRYGGQSSYDSTPIIPTLASPAALPQTGISGAQYRKQMTAVKKQAYAQASKLAQGQADPRAMSLQVGHNPYQPPVDPRSMSMTSQGPMNAPRASSLVGPHPQHQFQPRANSLVNNKNFQPNGYRAQSLTTNPYQQQQQYGPMPPMARPNQGHAQPVHRPSSSGPFPPPPNLQSYRPQGPPPPAAAQQLQPPLQHQHQHQQPLPQQQQPSLQPQQHPAPAPVRHQQQQGSAVTQSHSSNSSNLSLPVQTNGRHYLADNVVEDDDEEESNSTNTNNVSTTSFSDVSTNNAIPNGESTPSPENSRNSLQDSTYISPSKLPRSKALPHLSLMKMRDEEKDENLESGNSTDSEIYQPQQQDSVQQEPQARNVFVPSVLDPVDESRPYQAPTPPPFGETGERDRISGYISNNSSPMKNMNSHSKNHSKNAFSISSMSEYSTVSDNYDYNNGNNKKLYQLADKSSTAHNDVFVTASQFSLIDTESQTTFRRESNGDNTTFGTPKLDSYYDDKTPVAVQQSPYAERSQRLSIDSTKEALESPKIIKRWSQKRDSSFKASPVKTPTETKRDVSLGSTETLNKTRAIDEDSTPVVSTTTPVARKEVPALSSDLLTQRTTKVKELNLTVDQLGIMEDKSVVLRELDLVSQELAESIKRELVLEEKLQGNAISSSPPASRDHDQVRNNALEISRLTQALTEERTKRYIAEEHVLLQEHGVKPSALELNFENEELKSELFKKNELINKQAAMIEALKAEIPFKQSKIDELSSTNRELEEANDSLKNEVEILKDGGQKLSILSQKYKILKSEKEQLEKELQTKVSTPRNKENLSLDLSNELKFQSQRDFYTGKSPTSANTSIDYSKPPSPFNSKRITSFSLINVAPPRN